jgi:hypothetical protein
MQPELTSNTSGDGAPQRANGETEPVTQSALGVEIPSVASEIIDSAPEIQPHVIEQHAELESLAPRDADGVPFDPNIHARAHDGSGSKTASGRWRRRKGAGAAPRTNRIYGNTIIEPQSQIGGAPQRDLGTEAARAAGIALAQMTFIMGQVVGGAEWAAKKVQDETGKTVLDEDAMLTDAYAKYCATKGIADIPPGLALCFALSCYALPRFAQPETQSRVLTVREWCSMRVAKWRVQRALRKQGIEATVTVARVGVDPSKLMRRYQLYVNGEPYAPPIKK